MNFWNETAKNYDKRHETPRLRYLRDRETDVIKKFSRGKVLDLGCGTGFAMLELKNLETVGVDSSIKSLLVLKEKYPKAKIVLADCSRLPFKNKFDTVVSTLSPINYVESPKAVLEELRRVVNESSKLVFSITGHWNVGFFQRAKLKNLKREKKMQIEKHKIKTTLYGFEKIVSLFKKSGFELEFGEGVFIFVKILWGNFAKFTPFERILLVFEKIFGRRLVHYSGIYLLVFTKHAP